MDSILSTFQYLAQSNTINFVLMVLILWWIVSKFNLGVVFENSVQEIETSIKKSDETKQNAQKQLDNAKDEIKKLPEELSKIENEAEEKALNLKTQIESFGEKKIKNIAQSASKVLNIEEKKISSDVIDIAMKRTVLSAKESIKSNLKSNPELHYKFIEESLIELDKVKL